jgi:DNA-binding MarR family transcriptional regulator
MDAIETIIGREMHPRKEDVDAMMDISPPEMRSLMWLGKYGMTVMTEFAQGIGVPLSTATRIVNRLVKKGLAVRCRSDHDRRIVEVDLSPIAYKHKNRFMAKRLATNQKLLSTLTSPERETMLTLLEKALVLSEPRAPRTLRKNS